MESLLAPLSSHGEIAHCLQAVQVVSLVQGDRNQMPPGTWDLLLGSLHGPQSTSTSTNGVGCHPSCFICGQTKAEGASIVTLQAEPQTYNLSPGKAFQGRGERCGNSELACTDRRGHPPGGVDSAVFWEKPSADLRSHWLLN